MTGVSSRVALPSWSATSRKEGHRSPRMWAAVLGLGAIYLGSTILTLYPIYERRFGFDELVVSEIYAAYVIGNLAVLFFFGRISDQIGRRITALLSLGLTGASALSFLFATDTAWLFVTRALNGFAAGLSAGALTAWIAELEPGHDRVRAAAAASAGNLGGLAFGALGAGLLARYVAWPLRTSFVLYLVLLAAVFAILRAAPETVAHPVVRLAQVSLRPRIGVPRGLRWVFVAPAALAFASFALGGFYAALAPGLLVQGMHRTNVAVIGAVVALFFGTAAAVAFATRRTESGSTLRGAVGLLLLGLALLLVAEARAALPLLLLATCVTGAALALGYRGSLQIINEIAPEQQRAELVSSYLLVCYTANSLPVLGVGVLSRQLSRAQAHHVFALVLALLGILAAVVGTRHQRRGRDT